MAGISFGINHYISSDGADISSGQFNELLRIPGNHNRCTLLAASVPKTYYLIRDGDNTLTVDGFTKIIPEGNYSVISLSTALSTAIGGTCTVTASLVLGVLTFTWTDGNHTVVVASERLAYILGFLPGISYTSTFSSPTYVLVAPRSFTMTATSLIWILSNVVRNESPTAPGGTLSHFFVNDQQSLSYITYSNPCPLESSVQLATPWQATTQAFPVLATFFLKDDMIRTLNFNGLACDFVIRTWFEPPMYDMLSQYFSARLAIEQEKRVQGQQPQLASQI